MASRKRKWDDPGDAAVGEASATSTPAESAADAAAVALKRAQEINEMLSKRLGGTVGLGGSASNAPVFSDELEINDLPPHVRYRMTKGETQKAISQETGAAVTTKGMYRPPGGSLPVGEKPIHLFVEGPTQEAVSNAMEKLRVLLAGGGGGGGGGGGSAMGIGGGGGVSTPGISSGGGYGSGANSSFGLSGPDVKSEKVFVGLAGNDFRSKGKILGPRGSHVKHIEQACGVRVQLRGRGSGFREGATNQESDEPMHVYVYGTNAEGVAKGKELAESLLKTVRAAFGVSEPLPPPPPVGQGPPQPPGHPPQPPSAPPTGAGRGGYAASPSYPQPPGMYAQNQPYGGGRGFPPQPQYGNMPPMPPGVPPGSYPGPPQPPVGLQSMAGAAYNPYAQQQAMYAQQQNAMFAQIQAAQDYVKQNKEAEENKRQRTDDAPGPQLPTPGTSFNTLPEVPSSQNDNSGASNDGNNSVAPGTAKATRPLLPGYSGTAKPPENQSISSGNGNTNNTSAGGMPFWAYPNAATGGEGAGGPANTPGSIATEEDDKEKKYRDLMKELGM